MKTKVLHIINDLTDGGAQKALVNLVISDKESEHYVVSLTEMGKYGLILKKYGIDCFALGLASWLDVTSVTHQLYKIIRAISPDCVHTWLYHSDFIGGVLSRFAGVKNVVWSIHNSKLIYKRSSVATIVLCRINAVLSWIVPKRIVFVANAGLKWHLRIGFAAKKCFVIPNGYSFNEFMFLKSKNFRDSSTVIGVVARFDPIKGHDIFLQAIRSLQGQTKNIEVVFYGAGTEESNGSFQELLAQYPIEYPIRCMGSVDDISLAYSTMTILVLPSLQEAFPNVLAEAMLCGVPCVSSDVGDAKEILGRWGWLSRPGDPNDLANQIRNALDLRKSESNWEKQCKGARAHIQKQYGLEKTISLYRSVWKI